MIIASGILWGSIGLFAKTLSDIGFSSAQIAAVRLIAAAVILVAVNFKSLRINPRDWWMFASLGIGSLLSMFFLYLEAIKYTSLTIAAILEYTAPIMVMIMSAIFYRERITTKKLTALAAAFCGTVLISGFDTSGSVTAWGITLGLLSGFAYSLYSIIGKFVLKKYPPLVTAAYSFVFAALASVLLCDFPSLIHKTVHSEKVLFTILVMFGSGLITAALPYILYTYGLNHVPAGEASVMTAAEPLTAALLGVFIYNERLGIASIVGMLLIVSAVVILSLSKQE